MLDNEQTPLPPVGVLAPSQNEICQAELDEQAELRYVRNTRLAINRHLMPNGTIPDDKENLEMLMKNLGEMDRSAVGRARIKSEEKSSQQANEGMIALVGQTLQALRGGKALPPRDITDVIDAKNTAPQLPVELENQEFAPGEMQIGTQHDDVDQFKARMNEKFERDGLI